MIKKAKQICIIAVLSLTISSAAVPVTPTVQVQAKGVYIARTGKKYHIRRNCRTLSRSRGVKKLKLKTAKKRGYTRCKVCGY